MPAKKSVDKKRASGPVSDQDASEDAGKLSKESHSVSHRCNVTTDPVINTEDTTDTKKRTRKPRGSKIVTKQQIASIAVPSIANIVLNLKCSMSDLKEYNERLSKMILNPLEYNSSVPPEVKFYDGAKTFGTLLGDNTPTDQSAASFTASNREDKWNLNNADLHVVPETFANYSRVSPEMQPSETPDDTSKHEDLERWAESTRANAAEDVNSKEMLSKLKQLKIQLYKNALHCDKKSACFWCTYDFDNASCYIPKYEMDGTIYGYGSFCRPECAVAYLMKESIDDSTKFDRYHLLNQIYSKVYDCKKNIKPAPDPHYLLDKFYGNLTIQEYRKLLKTEHLLLVIDKPLTRILPELHEDNDDAFTKIYGIKPATANGNTTGVYKVKRQSEQPAGPSKASIIRNKFGLSN